MVAGDRRRRVLRDRRDRRGVLDEDVWLAADRALPRRLVADGDRDRVLAERREGARQLGSRRTSASSFRRRPADLGGADDVVTRAPARSPSRRGAPGSDRRRGVTIGAPPRRRGTPGRRERERGDEGARVHPGTSSAARQVGSRAWGRASADLDSLGQWTSSATSRCSRSASSRSRPSWSRCTSSRSATRRWSRAASRRRASSGSSGSPTTGCARSAARARSPRCSSGCPTGA